MHWVMMYDYFPLGCGEENLKATALINEDTFHRYKLHKSDAVIRQGTSLFYKQKSN